MKHEMSLKKAEKRKVQPLRLSTSTSIGCIAKHGFGASATRCMQEVYSQAVKKQADRVSRILKKASEQQNSMEREQERRSKALARRKLLRQLNAEYRMECVDTNKKQQLYGREMLLQKITAQTERVMQQQRDAGMHSEPPLGAQWDPRVMLCPDHM
jgi:coproporphyrinogen III oxidase-like Fe-S oxidoreductase